MRKSPALAGTAEPSNEATCRSAEENHTTNASQVTMPTA